MNQSDKSDERPILTSQLEAPPPSSTLLSNEKNPLSIIEKKPNTSTKENSSITDSKSTNSESINSSLSSVPQNCSKNLATSTQNSTAVNFKEESVKIVVSNESTNSHQDFKSELHSEPENSESQTKNLFKRPLVAYEEDEQKGESTPESATASLGKQASSLPETKEGQSVQEEKLFQTEFPASDAATLVEEQQPSTSTSGAATVDSSFTTEKPKTKRVRISIKLDHLSVLRLKRLATENPKLLRRFGLKAYRINNFNGSNNKFHVIKLPQPRPESQPQQPALSSNKPGRRQSRATSSSSTVTTPGSFNTSSPTRFRPPFSRVHSNFEFTKGSSTNFPMEQARTQQHFQYSSQFNQNPRPPQPQQQQQVQQQRYPSPVPQNQQQPQQRNMGQPEPGPSSVTDSPYLSTLLANNSQPQQSSQPGTPHTPQQIRYPPPGQSQIPPQQPQQQQQQPQQRMMNPPVYQQQPIQHQQQPIQHQQHMIQHNPYQQYPPPQRMQQHHMVPPNGPSMQPIPGQPPHMMPHGQIPQPTITTPQQESPTKAKAPRKRLTKKQKEQQQKEEQQRKQQQLQQQQMQQMGPGHMQHPGQQDYYMMQQRMPMPQGMAPPPQRVNYPPQNFPQGYPVQQPSTSMMTNYPSGQPQQHGYPGQQQPMWQSHEYQMQMHSQMMRPPVNQQNPGTPTSMHGYISQSPNYPQQNNQQQQQPQKIRMQTPNYPQPSPQYQSGQQQQSQQQQQQQHRQFMSPQNHPSPGFNQGQQTPNQYGYPQPQAPQQMMQQQGGQQPGQPQQTNIEEFNYGDFTGGTFENIGGLEDIAAEDLDSITPMNTDQPPPSTQPAQIIQQQGQGPPIQYDIHQHQYPHHHIQQQGHQQSPMGPPQGYHASPSYQQFQRPQSPQYMQIMQTQPMMHHQQQSQQQISTLEGPEIHTDDGDDTKITDIIPNSPPKISGIQEKNILDAMDAVLNKCRSTNCKEYAEKAWNDLKNSEEGTAPTSKRKSKSTNSRPPSRQPKNSQSSSTANTPTPGPIIAGNSSTGTEPSTPVKDEVFDAKMERKNSTLSNLLSGNSTPTVRSEENGINDASCSGGVISPATKSERDTTATPVSTGSTSIDADLMGHHHQTLGNDNKPTDGNNGHDQYLKLNGHLTHDQSALSMNEAVSLISKQDTKESSNVVESNDASLMPPPCKMRKTDDVIEDNSAKYFEHDLSATS